MPRNPLPRLAPLRTPSLALALLVLAGCGGGGGGDDGEVLGARASLVSLEQAVFDGSRYDYGALGAIHQITITGAPDDADASRWAMLHDGTTYRLYCMRLGDDTTLYQFGFNGSSYEYGYNSIPQIDITGTPPGADPSSIAMLHDGADFRLYMRDRGDPADLHQFAFNASTGDYEYAYRSIPRIGTTNLPADADLGRWAMLYDGSVYRQYVAQAGSATTLYQFGFDGRSYELGYRAIPEIDVVNMPSAGTRFAMAYGQDRYHFYHLSR